MQHYFGDIENNLVKLSSDDIHHITHVMRNKVNDEIIVICNKKEYLASITSFTPLKIEVKKMLNTNSELTKSVTLFFPLAKGDKIDLVIQKATELGVSKIVLIRGKRDVVKMSNDDFLRKLPRYQTIAKEASEQSRRQVIPTILGIYDIDKIPDELLCDVNYVAYEKKNEDKILIDLKGAESISYLVGSEGGISEEEINILNKQGFISISLGKRILRTETAAIYGLSVIGYNIEK